LSGVDIKVLKMNINQFHKAFKLQGKSFDSVDELLRFSKSISSEVFSFLSEWFSEESFVVVQTSGSTGKPKEIKLQKKYMVNSAIATGTYFTLFENTTALLCMSSSFIAGKMMLVRALTLGWDLDIIEPISNPIEKNNKPYDFCAMVPLQLANSLSGISKIKKIIVGGGVVSSELLYKIQNISTEIFATYGMTETITHIAVKKLNYHSERCEESHYEILPNISISKDERDCLIIDVPKLSDEIIVTNDIVQLISSTQFDWLGRYDTVINSGGIKLIPEQIEKKIASIISRRFFVTGIPDTVLGEKLILIVEGDTNKTLLKNVKKLVSLSKYEIPKDIYFVPKFKETETKKINRPKTIGLLIVN